MPYNLKMSRIDELVDVLQLNSCLDTSELQWSSLDLNVIVLLYFLIILGQSVRMRCDNRDGAIGLVISLRYYQVIKSRSLLEISCSASFNSRIAFWL